MAASGGTAEAERWLVIAEKLLAARDLQGSRTFAIRARESDPRLDRSDRILAVVETLLAGNSRNNSNPQQDWYAVLQLVPRTQDARLISAQYGRLAYLLNPATNTLPFADLAFRLISDAFSVLSNPSKKWLYDHELSLVPDSTHHHESQSSPSAPPPFPTPPPQPEPEQEPQSQPVKWNPRVAKSSEKPVEESISSDPDVPSFWTACPYCFNLYEYPKVYEECSLRCQNCRRAFHAVVVPPPPVNGTGKDSYFCCWEFFPLGFSVPNSKSTKKAKGVSNWAPFSAMFACPSPANGRPNVVEGTPYVHVPEVNKSVPKPRSATPANRRAARVLIEEEDEAFVEVSDQGEDSDDDWDTSNRKKKKAKNLKGGRGSGSKNVKSRKGGQGAAGEVKGSTGEISEAGYAMQESVGAVNMTKPDTGKKATASNSKRQTGKAAKDLGKLDLNVEFSNEVEEPPAAAISGNGPRNGEEDGMESIGFFEGLDEFLSSLPILSVVGDEKVKAAD